MTVFVPYLNINLDWKGTSQAIYVNASRTIVLGFLPISLTILDTYVCSNWLEAKLISDASFKGMRNSLQEGSIICLNIWKMESYL